MPDLVASFAALGEPTRFAIVERLFADGELTAGQLQSVAEVSPPAISRHLKVLRRAGLVKRRVDGQRRIYSVSRDAMEAIGAWTMSHREFWGGSLDRLELALKEADPWRR